MSLHFSQLWLQFTCVTVLLQAPLLSAASKTRHLVGGKEKISKFRNATMSRVATTTQRTPADQLQLFPTINHPVANNGITAKHFKNKENPSSTSPTQGNSMESSDVNLAVLPILAVIIFIVCMCLKCCTWFREDVKQREGDYEVETGFVILNEGDSEYNDVEFRSDSTSVGYDTVSSYASFIKRNNNYDTVTSVRSLQLPRNSDTYNSYRSFLLQRLDGSRQNSVNSYRTFLQKATQMKDVQVQVELLDIAPLPPCPSPPTQKSRNIPNDQASLKYSNSRQHRHNSCDAIVLPSKSPKSSESSEASTSPNSPDRKSRHIRRSKHKVSFADNSKGSKVLGSRSVSSVDVEHSVSNMKNIGRHIERQRSVSPLCLPKHIWASRFSSRIKVREDSLENPTSTIQQRNEISDNHSSKTEEIPEVIVSVPKKANRFKVSRTVESLDNSICISDYDKASTSEMTNTIDRDDSSDQVNGACAADYDADVFSDTLSVDMFESVSNDCLKNVCEVVQNKQSNTKSSKRDSKMSDVKTRNRCPLQKNGQAFESHPLNNIEDSKNTNNGNNFVGNNNRNDNKAKDINSERLSSKDISNSDEGALEESPCIVCGVAHSCQKESVSNLTIEDTTCSDDSDSGVCSEFLPFVHMNDDMDPGDSLSPE